MIENPIIKINLVFITAMFQEIVKAIRIYQTNFACTIEMVWTDLKSISYV